MMILSAKQETSAPCNRSSTMQNSVAKVRYYPLISNDAVTSEEETDKKKLNGRTPSLNEMQCTDTNDYRRSKICRQNRDHKRNSGDQLSPITPTPRNTCSNNKQRPLSSMALGCQPPGLSLRANGLRTKFRSMRLLPISCQHRKTLTFTCLVCGTTAVSGEA